MNDTIDSYHVRKHQPKRRKETMTEMVKEELVLDLARVGRIEDPDQVASGVALLAYRWATDDNDLGRAMAQVVDSLALDQATASDRLPGESDRDWQSRGREDEAMERLVAAAMRL